MDRQTTPQPTPAIPRVLRRLHDNKFHRKEHDPSISIGHPAQTLKPEFAEQAGWVPPDDVEPQLLLAAHGGYQRALDAHMECVSVHETLEDNAGLVKSTLDSYARPADFTWIVLSNGRVTISGEIDAPPRVDALEVRVELVGMLDAQSVDEDVAMPPLEVGKFVTRRLPGHARGSAISFSKDVELVGLAENAPEHAKQVAHDAALSFVRPSENRARQLLVSVRAANDDDEPVGDVVRSRIFDVEYRWRALDREEARFAGTAAELNGELVARADAVVEGIKNREIVAAVIMHATRPAPHTEATLTSRLRHYDARLVADPELLKNDDVLKVIGATSEALMPVLKKALHDAPERGEDASFVGTYNICATYCAETPLAGL